MFTPSGYSNTTVSRAMSEGTSMRTGPGLPVTAMWNASRNTRVKSETDCSRNECLTTGMVMPKMSDS